MHVVWLFVRSVYIAIYLFYTHKNCSTKNNSNNNDNYIYIYIIYKYIYIYWTLKYWIWPIVHILEVTKNILIFIVNILLRRLKLKITFEINIGIKRYLLQKLSMSQCGITASSEQESELISVWILRYILFHMLIKVHSCIFCPYFILIYCSLLLICICNLLIRL